MLGGLQEGVSSAVNVHKEVSEENLISSITHKYFHFVLFCFSFSFFLFYNVGKLLSWCGGLGGGEEGLGRMYS